MALTRAERTLLVSAHWWGRTGSKPKGPSTFFTEVAALVAPDARRRPPPPEDEENPLATAERTALWPADPLALGRTDVRDGRGDGARDAGRRCGRVRAS